MARVAVILGLCLILAFVSAPGKADARAKFRWVGEIQSDRFVFPGWVFGRTQSWWSQRPLGINRSEMRRHWKSTRAARQGRGLGGSTGSHPDLGEAPDVSASDPAGNGVAADTDALVVPLPSGFLLLGTCFGSLVLLREFQRGKPA